jgi:hypothetical protein
MECAICYSAGLRAAVYDHFLHLGSLPADSDNASLSPRNFGCQEENYVF